MAVDKVRNILSSFLNSRPHQHASEEALACIDLLWDELGELEPEEQRLLIRTKDRVQRCIVCSNSLRAMDSHFQSLISTG